MNEADEVLSQPKKRQLYKPVWLCLGGARLSSPKRRGGPGGFSPLWRRRREPMGEVSGDIFGGGFGGFGGSRSANPNGPRKGQDPAGCAFP